MKFNIGSMKDVLLATPLIEEGTYFMEIKKAEFVEGKKNKGQTNLALTLVFADEELYEFDSGEAVNNSNHNATVFDNLTLTPTGGLTEEIIKNKVARLVDAVARDKHAHESIEELDTESLVGRWVKVVIKHEPAKDGHAAKNRVASYLPILDSDNFNEPAF